MIKDCSIICLAGCEWAFTWQPTQEIMLRLAQAGNRVLYIEPTGTRNIKFTDWRRVVRRLRSKVGGPQLTHNVPSNLTIYSPVILPMPYSKIAIRINRMILMRTIQNWLHHNQQARVILWSYFPSPLNLAVMHAIQAHVTIYQIMSSAEAARPHPGLLRSSLDMLAQSDLIFANSRRLCEQAATLNSRAYLFRAGVNLEVFVQEGTTESERPEDLKQLGKTSYRLRGGSA